MSLDRIRELLKLMKENDLAELELAEKDFSVKLRKPALAPAAFHAVPVPAAPASAHPAQVVAAEGKDLLPIKSPIVGTFYRAPSPDAQPFASVGQKVNKQTVVAIIEAMKIMNEIKAGVDGTIEKAMVENGEPVEYGQPLFLVKP